MVTDTECASHEQWDDDGCEDTCKEPGFFCHNYGKCVCEIGYARNQYGLCIPEEKCPTPSTETTTSSSTTTTSYNRNKPKDSDPEITV